MYDNAKTNAITWVSIVKKAGTIGTFTISAFPNDVTYGTTAQTYSLFIKMTLDDNPAHTAEYTAFSIQVTSPSCNCNLLYWQLPTAHTQTVQVAATSTVTQISTPLATVIEASKSAHTDIRSCYPASPCDETYTLTATLLDGTSLPAAWMSFDAATAKISVNPLTSAAIGIWRIKLVQQTVSGFVTGTSVKPAFETVTLTVQCQVTAFANPAAPLLADRTYSIYSPTKSIDLAATFAL
jgi:hypothetical protein